jgi:NADH-quinone oxidoreductase subunit E
MTPKTALDEIAARIARTEHPREAAVDVMYLLQKHHGHLTDAALREGAALLGMSPLELEEIATFYDFIYRSPVGRLVLHVCDGVVCWMQHEGWEEHGESVIAYLCRKLGVRTGETTPDGLFTVLPTACIGHCESAPAMLVNGVAYGPLTPRRIDEILSRLREDHSPLAIDR